MLLAMESSNLVSHFSASGEEGRKEEERGGGGGRKEESLILLAALPLMPGSFSLLLSTHWLEGWEERGGRTTPHREGKEKEAGLEGTWRNGGRWK